MSIGIVDIITRGVPAVWRYKPRHSWEPMPELVGESEPLPAPSTEGLRFYPVTIEQDGLYRLTTDEGGAVHQVLVDDEGSFLRLEVAGEELAHCQALLDAGETPHEVYWHCMRQLFGSGAPYTHFNYRDAPTAEPPPAAG